MTPSRQLTCTEYRRRTWLILILFVPLVLAAFVVSFKVTGTNYIGVAMGAVLAVAYAYNGIRLGMCKCPQCGRRLNRFAMFGTIRCRHCGSDM